MIKAGNYQEFIPVATNADYEVSFLPEGGNLVSDVLCRIAFKVLNEQGQGEAIKGVVKDEEGYTIVAEGVGDDGTLLHFEKQIGN